MELVADNTKQITVLSVYSLDTKAKSDFDDWRLMWGFVGKHYGSRAVCRGIFRIEASVQDVSRALDQSCDYLSLLNSLLTDERAKGATHAFVQPEIGDAVFGINLSQLFG